MEIDRPAERRQVFDEAWRVMNNRFYDPKMHGVDWDAAKETYEPLLAYVADNEELHNVIMEMIGELNASHTGISGGDDPDAPAERIQTRYPGFDLEPDASGYYKVAYIYRKGPADHDYVKLKPGDFILAVNGKELKTSDNYWKLFNLVPGRKFEFPVNSKPEADGAWTVGLEPLDGRRPGRPGIRALGGRPQGHGRQALRRTRSATCTSAPWTPARSRSSSATCSTTSTRRP